MDGYYVLYTSLKAEAVPALELLRRWKRQGGLERRFLDWKGPLLVRPVFLETPNRIAALLLLLSLALLLLLSLALLLLLSLALLLFYLIEREARRRLAEQGRTKLPRLLAGHVDAVPAGENLLRAFENLLLVVEEGQHGRECWPNPLHSVQENLRKLLGIGTPAWT